VSRSSHYKRSDWRESNPQLLTLLPNVKKYASPIIAWYREARNSTMPSFGLLDDVLNGLLIGSDRTQLKKLSDSLQSNPRRAEVRLNVLSFASHIESLLTHKEIPFLRNLIDLLRFVAAILDGNASDPALLVDFSQKRQMLIGWLKNFFYSPFTYINVQKPYWELKAAAEAGDPDAFVELVRVDKGCIVDSWAKDVYLRLLAERDTRILKRLSHVFVSSVVDRREKKVEAFAFAYQIVAVSNGDLTLGDVCDILLEISPKLDVGEENLRKMFAERAGGFAKVMKGVQEAASYRKQVT
jgi:hypothetical protein